MILVSMQSVEIYFRALTPKWAHMPLSGAGAATKGGRLNEIGVHALYLSEHSQTAIEEYQQGSSIMPPLTLASYKVKLANVVDFRGGYNNKDWSPEWQELYCNFRSISMRNKAVPPSWILGQFAIRAGAAAIAYPSRADPGRNNLVVYTQYLKKGDQLKVYDPKNLLPKNQLSWSAKNQ